MSAAFWRNSQNSTAAITMTATIANIAQQYASTLIAGVWCSTSAWRGHFSLNVAPTSAAVPDRVLDEGVVAGTLAYMAPEQLRSQAPSAGSDN